LIEPDGGNSPSLSRETDGPRGREARHPNARKPTARGANGPRLRDDRFPFLADHAKKQKHEDRLPNGDQAEATDARRRLRLRPAR
jgi:hypothetical protein